MPIVQDPAAIASVKIDQLRRWWLSKCGQRRFPDRADLDPAELKPLLPYILISERLEPFNVRYRLVGTRVVGITGLDITGRDLAALTPPDATED
ncbi:MAG: PAS domain-containing protein [Rhodospirillaceae bacterium]|nr:PAS domain-containing protein [Rhodospirillaceae bacterium]